MIAELLNRIPVFAALPCSEIEHLLATLRQAEYPAQALLFREGRADDHCCILVQGEVEILKALGTADERRLAVCQGGALLGEMGLFSQDGTHTASVRALTSVIVLELTRAEFDALLRRQPSLAYGLMQILSRRLDESEHATILDLREKNRQLTVAYRELQAAQAQIIEKERLERELEIARQIQRSILPQALPSRPGFDLGALMIPARQVGGDFYDVLQLNDDHVAIVVGDVCGKGVPAALFMALTYSLVRAEASRNLTPGQTLRAVNRHLLGINTSGTFVTLLYVALDCAAHRLAYARAGHPQPLIMDEHCRPVQLPSATGQFLGLFDDPLLDEQSLPIAPGSLALMFSDGLTEAADAQGTEFGTERLCAFLEAHHEAGAQAICEGLWQEVQSHADLSVVQDDFTVAAIKVTG